MPRSNGAWPAQRGGHAGPRGAAAHAVADAARGPVRHDRRDCRPDRAQRIGVNIAPLLAGAGIVGVAIGFGSQKLVQDVVTGMFVLFENAVQVGDWVTVAGLSGKIEQLSVRTIWLRGSRRRAANRAVQFGRHDH